MTKPQSLFHYLLIGLFMLSMLMPAAHAENNDMAVHHEMSQQQHDCHSDAAPKQNTMPIRIAPVTIVSVRLRIAMLPVC